MYKDIVLRTTFGAAKVTKSPLFLTQRPTTNHQLHIAIPQPVRRELAVTAVFIFFMF